MFDTGRAIVKIEQDHLGRAVFSKYLARCMLDHTTSESLVLGLYGGWGTGKTSIINMTLEELRYAASNMFDQQKPVILNFSAWSYSGQNQLIYSFFRRLSSEIRQFPFFENSERIIYLLELYVSFFTHKPIPKSLRQERTGIFKFLKEKDENSYGWESGRDLTQVKAELNFLLSQQKHKIIIFIDNISRLEDSEINQIFQIVKSMGDFSNTIYLLALDKEQVIHALDKIHGNGQPYLDKIVQLPFEIPPISSQDLENILLYRLNPIIQLVPEDSWNKEYWADIYYSILKYLFQTPRDITRYINTLSFSYPHVKDIVNPVDFFAMTAVYVFSPNVFYGIRDNKDLFTDLVENIYSFDQQKLNEDKLRCDEILNRPGKIEREHLLRLLILLFPRLRKIYETNVSFHHSESIARKNWRICTSDIFEVYFRLSMSTGIISEAEMNAILALAQDEEGFDLALLRLNQDEKIARFLDLLDGTVSKKIAKENILNVLSGLMDSADLFPEGESSSISFNTPMRLHRIFHQLLNCFENSEDRYHIFEEAIKKANKSLYIIIHELNLQSEQHQETEDTSVPVEHRDFLPDQLEALQKQAVTKIRYWADIGRLIEHPKLIPILYTWKKWGEEEQCINYVAAITSNDKGLVAFLTAVFKEAIDEALTKYEVNRSWKQYLSRVEDFISPSILEIHAKELFEDAYFEKLREREQLAILIFLDLTGVRTLKTIPKTTV